MLSGGRARVRAVVALLISRMVEKMAAMIYAVAEGIV
jgi:hypothetical protein